MTSAQYNTPSDSSLCPTPSSSGSQQPPMSHPQLPSSSSSQSHFSLSAYSDQNYVLQTLSYCMPTATFTMNLTSLQFTLRPVAILRGGPPLHRLETIRRLGTIRQLETIRYSCCNNYHNIHFGINTYRTTVTNP